MNSRSGRSFEPREGKRQAEKDDRHLEAPSCERYFGVMLTWDEPIHLALQKDQLC